MAVIPILVRDRTEAATLPDVSFRNILIATDFSERSKAMLPYARMLGRGHDSHLYLTHVVPPEIVLLQPGVLDASEQIALGEMQELESDEHPRAWRHTHIGVGETWPVLQQMIENQHIDLVLVSTNGHKGLRKLIMGSVAEVIVRHAPCPVLTIGPHVDVLPGCEVTFSNVLYATDLNSHNAYAQLLAGALARENHGRLTMLYVVGADSDAAVATPALELLASRTNAEPLIELGKPVETIVATARERNADLIVLGVHRPEAMTSHRVHLAYRVVSEAQCPVLTVGTEFRWSS